MSSLSSVSFDIICTRSLGGWLIDRLIFFSSKVYFLWIQKRDDGGRILWEIRQLFFFSNCISHTLYKTCAAHAFTLYIDDCQLVFSRRLWRLFGWAMDGRRRWFDFHAAHHRDFLVVSFPFCPPRLDWRCWLILLNRGTFSHFVCQLLLFCHQLLFPLV